jgi:homoprotocatechuate degradation regulator HpaR
MTKKLNPPHQQQTANRQKPHKLALVSRALLRDDRQSLPIALLRAREAVMRHFRPHHRKGKITEPQWRVLRVLYLEGEMDATKLAGRSFLLQPSLSRILRDLEATDHVKRRTSEADSRQSLISLSAKGTAVVARAVPFVDRIHQLLVERFGAGRTMELLRLLAELEQALAMPESNHAELDGGNPMKDAATLRGRRKAAPQ